MSWRTINVTGEELEWAKQRAETLKTLTEQNIAQHNRIRDLEEALITIARKRKLDAVAAASMRAIAQAVLNQTSGMRDNG